MEGKRSWNDLPFDLWSKISEFIIPAIYTLSPDIDIKRFHPCAVSKHPKAIDILIANPLMIDIDGLCRNLNPKSALFLLRSPSEINWKCLSENPTLWAGEFILKHYEQKQTLQKSWDKRSLSGLSVSHNPQLLELLGRYPDYVHKYELSRNTSPHAITLLRRLPHLILWQILSQNSCPQAIELLFENIDKIIWYAFSANKNPRAFELMEAHLNKVHKGVISMNRSPHAIALMKLHSELINWFELSANSCPEAIPLLKLHPEKVDWINLSNNPCPQIMEMLIANPDKISWNYLVKCTYPEAIELLMANIESNIASGNFDNFQSLCNIQDSKAIKIISHHLNDDYNYWKLLSSNPHTAAINLLKSYPRHISCEHLCHNINPESVELLSLIENIVERDLSFLSETTNLHIINFICKYNLFPNLMFQNICDAHFITDDVILFKRRKEFLSSFNIRR